MKQKLFIFRRFLLNLIIPVTLLIFGLVLLPNVQAEEVAGSSPGNPPDQTPPRISYVKPLPDSVVDTEVPLIEAAFMDADSDIDLDSIRLLLDRMDVTAPAKAGIERVNGGESAASSSYIIRYHPAPLTQGIHEADFIVRDRAGNRIEARWSFEVKLPPKWGFRVSGSDTLQFNIINPIYLNPISAVQMLDLTVQGQSKDTNIQLHLFGQANANTTGYYYSNLDSYSLGIYHQRFGLVLGCTGISLDTELLQTGLEKGWVSYDTVDFPTGQYAWQAFSGSTTSNPGLDLFNVKKIEGVTSKWAAGTGWGLSSIALRLEGKNLIVNNEGVQEEEDVDRIADFTEIKGNSPLGRPLTFKYELIHGDSRTGVLGRAGNAVALHLDQIIAATGIGFDYMAFEADYPALSISSPLTGGAQRYTIRGNVPFANGQSLSASGSLTKKPAETPKNMYLGYNWNLGSDFGLNATYSRDVTNETNSDNSSYNLLFNVQKNFDLASFQNSFSLKQTRNQNTGESSNYHQFSGAWSWTRPLGKYNLIPRVNWMLQQLEDGTKQDTGEFRVTVDRQFHPEAARSTLDFYRTVNTNTQTLIFCATTGVALNLYFKPRRNSDLTITWYDNWSFTDNHAPDAQPHTEGWGQGASISWKWSF